jgi:hypothetical protein
MKHRHNWLMRVLACASLMLLIASMTGLLLSFREGGCSIIDHRRLDIHVRDTVFVWWRRTTVRFAPANGTHTLRRWGFWGFERSRLEYEVWYVKSDHSLGCRVDADDECRFSLLWPLAISLPLSIRPLRLLNERWFTYKPKPLGVCIQCGYDIRATPNRCPECGKVQ